jgi:hypothetical protein
MDVKWAVKNAVNNGVKNGVENGAKKCFTGVRLAHRWVMTSMEPNRGDTQNSDISRVSEQITGRLSRLGIDLDSSVSPDVLADLAAAVERFEAAVVAAGGDLMVDEPPRGQTGQPDRQGFALPHPAADESIEMYIGHLDQATEKIRSGIKGSPAP